jgi:predicted glycosyltransferase
VEGFRFKDQSEILGFIKDLSEYGRVFISSEIKLPKNIQSYELKIPYELVHDLIAHCSLYFGEGATMASEAAVLGVPSVFVSTLRLGYLDELQEKYGLVHSYSNQAEALPKVKELLSSSGTKAEWGRRRVKMLKDKIDVSRFISDLITDFPESLEQYKVHNG